jgi:hypothetical protein
MPAAGGTSKTRRAASRKTRRAPRSNSARLSTDDQFEGALMKPADVMSLIKDKGVQAVDVRFVDLPGLWQHFTVSAKEFSKDAFEEGLGFDGSSIRGFQEIQESDMLLMPDPATAFLDPFTGPRHWCSSATSRIP